jgi:hypothetical protein
MIMTKQDGELPLPLALAENGSKTFTYAEIEPGFTYYLVTLEVVLVGLSYNRTFILSNIAQVSDIVAQSGEDAGIQSIQCLSPSELPVAQFKLRNVAEIWIAQSNRGQAQRIVFEDGKVIDHGTLKRADWQKIWPIDK